MLDEAIQFCNETAADYMGEAMQYDECDEWEWVHKCTNEERAANYKQIAKWLTELQQKRDAVKHLSEWNRKLTEYKNEIVCKYGESQEQLKEAKRLLRLAVKDFALLDRDYSIDGGCTLREVCCEDCPLNNEKDEPCHEWRFKGEAEKLLGEKI